MRNSKKLLLILCTISFIPNNLYSEESNKMPKEIIFSELIERAPSGKPNYQWAQEFANSKLEIK